jgi:hypothetical protein
LASLQFPWEEELKNVEEQRFDEWLKGIKSVVSVVLPLPYDKIDWPQVVSKSIWRQAPLFAAELLLKSEAARQILTAN